MHPEFRILALLFLAHTTMACGGSAPSGWTTDPAVSDPSSPMAAPETAPETSDAGPLPTPAADAGAPGDTQDAAPPGYVGDQDAALPAPGLPGPTPDPSPSPSTPPVEPSPPDAGHPVEAAAPLVVGCSLGSSNYVTSNRLGPMFPYLDGSYANAILYATTSNPSDNGVQVDAQHPPTVPCFVGSTCYVFYTPGPYGGTFSHATGTCE